MVQLAVVLNSLGSGSVSYTELVLVLDCYIINPRLHACAARVIVVCLCVCWVLGEEKEDSPRLWEECANLTACGFLMVQGVYIYMHH